MNIKPDYTSEEFQAWFDHEHQVAPQVVTYHCPPDMPDCEPATALRYFDQVGRQVVMVGWTPTLHEIEQLRRGGTVFIRMVGALVPHSMHIVGPHIEARVQCDYCGELLQITDEPCDYCAAKDRDYTPECEVNKHWCKEKGTMTNVGGA